MFIEYKLFVLLYIIRCLKSMSLNKNIFSFFPQRISSFNSNKSQDKSLITTLERKLKNERDTRAQLESQLKESKKKTAAAVAQQLSLPSPTAENKAATDLKPVSHGACNARVAELENELNRIQAKLEEATQRLDTLKKEETVRKTNGTDNEMKMKKDLELLTNAFNAMQGKNLHLENSLSSETRLKLDLFSALGDTRRQLEITQDRMKEKCKEVDMLKGKIAEVMAVMPPQYHSSIGGAGNYGVGVVNGGVGGQTTVSKAAFITKNMDPVVVTTSNGVA